MSFFPATCRSANLAHKATLRPPRPLSASRIRYLSQTTIGHSHRGRKVKRLSTDKYKRFSHPKQSPRDRPRPPGFIETVKMALQGLLQSESIRKIVTGPGPSSSSANEPPAPVYDLYSWKDKSPNARLVYIRDVETANEELSRLRPGPVGFDLEWKPNVYKGQRENPVALVQIAADDTVLLIQVSAMDSFPQKLRDILLDESIVKAGVAIQNDCKKLYTDYQVSCRNCVNLGLLARTVDNPRWKGKYHHPVGLARLCEVYEQLTLTKGKISRTNWELNLSDQQQEYAANDSHVGLILYHRLSSMASAMSPVPKVEYYTFDCVDGRIVHPSSTMLWWPDNPHYDPGPPPPTREPKDPASSGGRPEEGRGRGRGRGKGRRTRADFPRAQDVTIVAQPNQHPYRRQPQSWPASTQSRQESHTPFGPEHNFGLAWPQHAPVINDRHTQAFPGQYFDSGSAQMDAPIPYPRRGGPRRPRGGKGDSRHRGSSSIEIHP